MDCYSNYCSDCKKDTQVDYNHSSGDTICHECGLFLEEHFISDTCEWRTFAADNLDSSGGRDPNRIGCASDPLLSHNHLTTTISKGQGKSAPLSSSSDLLLRKGNHGGPGPDPDQALIRGFDTIATMSDRLDLVTMIRDRAKEIFKRVVEDHNNVFKGRKNKDAILAACLYIACAQEHKPRTLKEISSVANGATQKEICRAKKNIEQQFKQDMDMDAPTHIPIPSMEGREIHAADFVARFCSHLNLKFQTIKAAQEAVKRSEQVDIRRNPTTVVAAVIYMITQLSPDDKRFLKDISAATLVAENTIREAYKEVYPYASRLIPCSYARAKDLMNLAAP